MFSTNELQHNVSEEDFRQAREYVEMCANSASQRSNTGFEFVKKFQQMLELMFSIEDNDPVLIEFVKLVARNYTNPLPHHSMMQ